MDFLPVFEKLIDLIPSLNAVTVFSLCLTTVAVVAIKAVADVSRSGRRDK